MSARIAELEWWKLEIPFRVAFKHAGVSRVVTESMWVEATDALARVGYGESCPRTYVTGETVQTCGAFLADHRDAIIDEIQCVASLRDWVESHTAEIDAAPAAWCAAELAILDLFARQSSSTFESLLGVSALEDPFQYTAVLGDQSGDAFTAQVAQFSKWGFEDFKLKLSGNINRDTEKLDHLSELGISPDRVRLDANNLWESTVDALDYLQPLADRFAAIEEPLRSMEIGQLRRLSGELERPVILDESFLRLAQFGELDSDPGRFWINVRVSKMGGLIRSLDVIDQAEEIGITVIVGAQVGETSLLTRGGMTVAQHARRVLRGQEGAFGTHLLQADVVDPPLMFGHGGRIAIDDHPQCVRPTDVIRPEAFLSLISKA